MTSDDAMFPRSGPQPASLTIVDLRVQDGIDTTDAIASARALQGLVNRSSADKVYLFNDVTDCTHDINGRDWPVQREWLARTELSQLPQRELTRAAGTNGGLRALVSAYRDDVTGLVIWDPNPHNGVAQATFGAAVTIAAQRGALPVSPAVADEIRAWDIDLPVLEDLRRLHFQHDHEVLVWSVDTLWETSNRQANSVFSLGLDGWSPQDTWADDWWSNTVFHEGPIDYAVAVNGFCFNINMSDGYDDHALMRLLDRYPEGRTAVLGWIPTHPYLYGFAEAPACLNRTSYYVIGVNGFSNLSVFGAYPPYVAKPEMNRVEAPDPADINLAFLVTDGDALHCVYRGMFSAFTDRRGSDFDTAPLTWSMSPALAALAPPVYRFFVDSLPAGCGMVAAWADKVHTPYDTGLRDVVSDVRERSRRAGMDVLWTVHSTPDTQSGVRDPWDGIVVGYSDSRVAAHVDQALGSTVVLGTWSFGGGTVQEIVAGIRDLAAAQQAAPLYATIVVGAAFDDSGDFARRVNAVIAAIGDTIDGRSVAWGTAESLVASYRRRLAASC